MGIDAGNRAAGGHVGAGTGVREPGGTAGQPARYRINGRELRDLLVWLVLAAVGLALTACAVRYGARLGTASAPFLGSYRFQVSPLSLVAPLVAATVLLVRQADRGLEVYLLRRVASMRFAPGMYAFPGGSVDPRDSDHTIRWSGPPTRQSCCD